MAQVNQQQCDNCGEVLTGQKGTTKIYKAFISVKGQMGVGVVDPDTKWREFYYLSPRSDADMAFCDEACLHEYIGTRLEIAKAKRLQRLREEATLDQQYKDDPYNDPRNKGGYNSNDFAKEYGDPKKKHGLYS